MTTVVLCGKKEDREIGSVLTGALKNCGGVQYWGGGFLRREGAESPDFLIYDCERVPRTNFGEGLLLFKSSFVPGGDRVPPGFLSVFESVNAGAAAVLKGTGETAVVCGTSSRDTLSIASLEELRAVVSLQRTLKSISGEVLEPGDITVELSRPMGPYPVLAVCAVLLLSGRDPGEGYRF